MRPRHSSIRSDMNVAPLVDIVLVLLIVFILFTPAAEGAVRLPTARHAPGQGGAPRVSLVLAGTAAGEVRIEDPDQRYSLGLASGRVAFERQVQALLARGADRRVLLKADARLPAARLQPLLEALRTAGAEGLDVATQPTALPPGV